MRCYTKLRLLLLDPHLLRHGRQAVSSTSSPLSLLLRNVISSHLRSRFAPHPGSLSPAGRHGTMALAALLPLALSPPRSGTPAPKSSVSLLGKLTNTRFWSQDYDNDISICIPPSFEDIHFHHGGWFNGIFDKRRRIPLGSGVEEEWSIHWKPIEFNRYQF
jgi:hypothetical protein